MFFLFSFTRGATRTLNPFDSISCYMDFSLLAVYTSRSFGISRVLHYKRSCGPLSLSVSHLLPLRVLIVRLAVLARGSKEESVGTGQTGTGTRLHG